MKVQNLFEHEILEDQQNLAQNVSRKQRKSWNSIEDARLRKAISEIGTKWQEVARHMGDCTGSQCSQRWKRIKPKNKRTRQVWSSKEDNILLRMVQEVGCKWATIRPFLKKRSGKQIRERYLNHLDPKILKDDWTIEEDQMIITLYHAHGSKWTVMSELMTGRPELQIKNRFYSFLRYHYLKEQNPYYQLRNRQIYSQPSPPKQSYLQVMIDELECFNIVDQVSDNKDFVQIFTKTFSICSEDLRTNQDFEDFRPLKQGNTYMKHVLSLINSGPMQNPLEQMNHNEL